MISLVARRPVEPKDFAAETRDARLALDTKVAAKEILTESDFPDLWSAYKYLLADAQHGGKCAYCEDIAGYKEGTIDHYRPKACVIALKRGDRDDTRGKRPGREQGEREGGYWWLAYAWTNYVLACGECNKVWKQNQFPIRGRRASKPGKEGKERRLLLNPFDDDPGPHLGYDELTGAITGRTDEGTQTIHVCGLDRKSLDDQRRIKAEKLAKRVQEYVDALVMGNEQATRNALRCLLDECGDAERFAGMARALVSAKIGLTYEDLVAASAQGQI